MLVGSTLASLKDQDFSFWVAFARAHDLDSVFFPSNPIDTASACTEQL